MSDEVRLPVEGLWTLVTFILPLLRVGQSVGLQTATKNLNNSFRNVRSIMFVSDSPICVPRAYIFEGVSYSLTFGCQGISGHTPYTHEDHGTCGVVAGLVVPGPAGHCPLLETSE